MNYPLRGMIFRRSAMLATLFTLIVAMGAPSGAQSQDQVTSFSGSGQEGLTDGDATTGQFNRPHGLAIDAEGNIYVSDRGNHAIRVVAEDGAIQTLAGNGEPGNADGVGSEASFRQPIAVVVDGSGIVYVADRDNHTVRSIDPSGAVSLFAGTGVAGFTGGAADEAQFNEPYGVALSPDESILYVADYLNHAIRAIDLATQQVTTLAGNGTAGLADGLGDEAMFNQPYNVKTDAEGILYVPDQLNHAIRRVDPDGTVTTIAGNGESGFADGESSDARFDNPTGLVVAPDGMIYVADRNNNRIRLVSPEGSVSTIAGEGVAGHEDGPGESARFDRPIDVVIAADGSLVVSEDNNHRLRKISLR